MSSPTPEPNHTARQSLAHLAAGELGSLAAWRLRRQIARDPALAREWGETQRLWASLKTLQTLDARPVWPAAQQSSASARDRAAPRLRPITGVPRIALSGVAAVALAATFALYQRPMFSEPEPARTVYSNGNYRFYSSGYFRFSVDSNPPERAAMRGVIVFYDRQGRPVYNYSSAGDASTPVVQNADQVTTVVKNDNQRFELRGAGRHSVYDRNHRLLGYVALFPDTAVERAQWWKRFGKTLDFGATPPLGRNNIGWGRAWGEYPTKQGRVRWELRGSGQVQLRNARTGIVLRRSVARPVNPSIRRDLREQLPPDVFASCVAEAPPMMRELHIIGGGKSRVIRGFGTTAIRLPDGTPATIEIAPLEQ